MNTPSRTITSVNPAEPRVLLARADGDVVSAIDKQPATTPRLWFSTTNLEGDRQADMRPTASGACPCGEHQAMHSYPAVYGINIRAQRG